tara:strand:+ start:2546 stop:3904 length:1359 start_codon:yes stop_codon:yes gene_type:complete
MDQKEKNKTLKKIFIKSFGCQMNEYDSQRMYDITSKINYKKSNEFNNKVNCVVLNTCHIREKASEKLFHEVGRIKKIFKNTKKPIVIVAGCVAQAEGNYITKRENYVDAIVGPQSYHKLNRIIKELEKKDDIINLTEFDTIKKFDELHKIRNKNNNVSSFLTIQEGCDKFCKFCVVPYTRGPECSRSFSNIIQEAKQLVENGSREITLLGQNVNAYKFGKKKLSDLIYSLNEIKELDRIRYTSSHPNDVTPDLITSHKDCKKLMPLLHLPVQSGSNNILEKMGRKHTVEQYIEITQKLKKVRPEIKFSSDFIISFPDETEKDFNDSINLLQNIKFINTYSFIYSSRPGTPASKLSEISRFISKKRLIKFQEEASKIKKNYKKSLMGTFTRVLFENKVDDQNYFGRDEFFNSVIVKSKKDIIGKVKNVRLEQCNQNTLFGELVQNNQKENVAA